jgi:TetR/AcrR family transcriptional regulator, transcriptional repressor for nem operon
VRYRSSASAHHFTDRPVGQLVWIGTLGKETSVATDVGNKRLAAAQQTRANLIETGLVLSEELGLEGLSVNAVVAAAGVSKGSFFHHFPDRASYLVAMHRRFHDKLFDEVMAVIGEMPPGRARLVAAARTYLDGCLRDRGVKALLLEARGHLPIADEVVRRNRMNVDVVAADFEALGYAHPRSAARLWIAATAECALMELETGRADESARSSLAEFTH